MNIFDKIGLFFTPKQSNLTADRNYNQYWSGRNMQVFDGEKTPNELGQPKEFLLDYNSLRQRSWEAYIKTDLIQNAIKKYLLWIVGAGLKLQLAPVEQLISDPQYDNKKFVQQVEATFRLFAKTKKSSFSEMQNLHEVAIEALKNALLAGDVLCVVRYDGINVNIELIDGCYIATPLNEKLIKDAQSRGNTIEQGVEIDKKGQHVAFFINQDNFQSIRVKARANCRTQAWLMYGLRHKITDTRGMSLLTAVLETTAKIDRYKEATLGTAEENSKLVYTIEHDQFSDGENPLVNQFKQSFGRNQGISNETNNPNDSENIADKIAVSTEKQAFNLPIGAKLNQHSGKVDVNFTPFHTSLTDIVYATLGIPPEVAMDKFGGAYSGSRAALKSWEYKMMVDRILTLQNQFYTPFFEYWLQIQIISNRISVAGYLDALFIKNDLLLSAYSNSRFIGAGVPHIDPVKEVTAERRKLGSKYNDVPLTTAEQSAEALNTGDFESIITVASREEELYRNFIHTNENQINTDDGL